MQERKPKTGIRKIAARVDINRYYKVKNLLGLKIPNVHKSDNRFINEIFIFLESLLTHAGGQNPEDAAAFLQDVLEKQGEERIREQLNVQKPIKSKELDVDIERLKNLLG